MSLEDAIKNKTLKNVDIAFIIYQIAEGMKYVHFQKIIHRDLKPSNILISSDGTVKIGDFGISKLMSAEEQSMTCGVGTQKFMAPEIIDEYETYDEKVDVYSFGVLMYYVLSGGDLPKIRMSYKLKGKKADVPSNFTDLACQLIYDCWNLKSCDRPSFEKIINEIEEKNYEVIDLNESEIDEVKDKVMIHKQKIPNYGKNE